MPVQQGDEAAVAAQKSQNRRTDSGIPAARQEQEAVCVSRGNPSHPRSHSHCSWLFRFSSQHTGFLWPGVLFSFTDEHAYWLCMKGVQELPELTLAKHGQYGPGAGTTPKPITRGILQ